MGNGKNKFNRKGKTYYINLINHTQNGLHLFIVHTHVHSLSEIGKYLSEKKNALGEKNFYFFIEKSNFFRSLVCI